MEKKEKKLTASEKVALGVLRILQDDPNYFFTAREMPYNSISYLDVSLTSNECSMKELVIILKKLLNLKPPKKKGDYLG